MTVRFIVLCLLMFFVAACQSKLPDSAAQHMISSETGAVNAGQKKVAKGPIPDIVQVTPFLVKPAESIQEERYTVVLHDVPVKELLFTLARDSNINIDIHSDIEGNATINAVEETLPSILERLARQVDFIYEIKSGVLVVRPDSKFWHTYKVDYLSMERSSSGSMTLDLKSTGDAKTASSTGVETTNDSKFWQPIVDGIINIIKLDDALIAADLAKREAAEKEAKAAEEDAEDEEKADEEATEEEDSGSDPVITHKSTGTISVLATGRQHKQVQIFFDNIMASSQRQVLIEASIVEVQLNDYFQRGIDWYRFASTGSTFGLGDRARQNVLTSTDTQAVPGSLRAGVNPIFALGHRFVSGGASYVLELKMLEEFGDVTVLSSPKVMAINNQAAMMKVVDEILYFRQEIETERDDEGNITNTEITYTAEKALDGIAMSVTPHISDDGVITLHVRPTISQLIDYKEDFEGNSVPYFQVREMESILRVPDGQTVVLGGLMKDRVSSKRSGLPGLKDIPFIGAMFEAKNREMQKVETAIFFRPTIMTPEKMRDVVESSKFSFKTVKDRFGEGKDWDSIKRKD
jgi:MSHA biogenesis protein MshL